MKKIVSVLLACLMICAAAFCVAEAGDVVGDWYLTDIVMDDAVYSAADFGMEMRITLNADGSAAISANVAEVGAAGGTWAMDGTTVSITVDGDTVSATFDGTALSMEQDGLVMRYTREAAEGFAAAPVKAAGSVSEFDGTWAATTVYFMDMYVPMSAIEGELESIGVYNGQIVIDNGNVTALGNETREFAFTDGALLFDGEESEGVEAGMNDEKIEMLEDGTIAYTVSILTFYCEPVL